MGVSSRHYWSGVLAYVVVLLSIQSLMGFGIDKFKELWGESALEVVASLIVGAGASGVVWAGWKVWARCSARERVWMAVALLLYGVGTATARYPQERLHYLGYGLLAMMLYVGFARDRGAAGAIAGPRQSTVLPAVSAMVFGSLVGLADELLQIVWPRRYFDWADVGMNVVAVAVGLLLVIPAWSAVQGEHGTPPITRTRS